MKSKLVLFVVLTLVVLSFSACGDGEKSGNSVAYDGSSDKCSNDIIYDAQKLEFKASTAESEFGAFYRNSFSADPVKLMTLLTDHLKDLHEFQAKYGDVTCVFGEGKSIEGKNVKNAIERTEKAIKDVSPAAEKARENRANPANGASGRNSLQENLSKFPQTWRAN